MGRPPPRDPQQPRHSSPAGEWDTLGPARSPAPALGGQRCPPPPPRRPAPPASAPLTTAIPRRLCRVGSGAWHRRLRQFGSSRVPDAPPTPRPGAARGWRAGVGAEGVRRAQSWRAWRVQAQWYHASERTLQESFRNAAGAHKHVLQTSKGSCMPQRCGGQGSEGGGVPVVHHPRPRLPLHTPRRQQARPPTCPPSPAARATPWRLNACCKCAR